ncbi:hypothetical protein DCAR_0729398 [Daucus carota subsp. sativus]|uniref:PTM/DIR17-like Tudor domain-containing protein n=1 Tax=Daucus carota subsp. sativus TaxID=79200 RepID=A0AAF1BAJ3_DAUCS|nr:hypothetical protein DCAR_0729398 [Daucus carota subsp. sativus]
MASSPTLPPPPSISEEELEEELTDVGNKLLKPPSSTDELLKLLDELGCLLSKVSQEPTLSMLDALQPSMKALMGTEILMHNDTDVKVWVASCISEIARIMAPNAPYSDDEMKKFFQLSIVAVEQLSNTSGRSYSRAVLVLKTLANIRLCVLMLDLELDDLILKMFERFLDIKSLPDALLSDMERIMTLIVEESEERSFELMSVLLKSVKRENQYVSPVSWELGQKVLKNCAGILVLDIQKAVSTMGMAYTEFSEIVASICQVAPKTDNVVASKVSGSTGNPRGRRKRGPVNTASQGDGKAKRKRAARKSETGDAADHGEELVGRKIKVWWPADDQFYKGVITGFDRELKKHKVEYVDGDQENLYLRAERWEIVEDIILSTADLPIIEIAAKIEVSWLQQCLTKCREAQGKIPSSISGGREEVPR